MAFNFNQMCDDIDEEFHHHGNVFMGIFVILVALIIWGIGYLAMHFQEIL